jgi:hypothetical protein
MMLLIRSIRFFLYEIFYLVQGRRNPIRTSGAEYLLYRSVVEAALLSLLTAFFVVNAFWPRYIESPNDSSLYAGITFVLMIVRGVWMSHRIRKQAYDEYLLYD